MAKLQSISILTLAKIFAALHAMIGLVLAVIITIGSVTTGQEDGVWSLGPWSLLVFPVVNSILGFVTGSIIAWGYNLFSQKFGGIEFEIEQNI